MSADDLAPADRFGQVRQPTTPLCDQVFDVQIMKRPLPEDQFRALASAARHLREYDVERPPLLTNVLNELALKVGGEEPSEND